MRQMNKNATTERTVVAAGCHKPRGDRSSASGIDRVSECDLDHTHEHLDDSGLHDRRLVAQTDRCSL
jgi:hypothetical protein